VRPGVQRVICPLELIFRRNLMPLRRVIAFIVIVIAPVVSSALEKNATPPKSEVKNGVRIERDIPYVPDGDPSQRLDLYLPEKGGDKPLPLLVWVHGGGWLGGSKGENPGAALTAGGEYASASVEYRFSDKAVFPAQIQDCQAAVRFLRANAAKYNIDPDHIGVWGGSAGGHLVALLGTAGGADAFPKIGENQSQSDRVQAVVDIFGPADFAAVKRQVAADKAVKNIFNFEDMSSPYAKLFGAVPGERPELEKSASPVTFVSKDDPPFLIIHGTADTLVPYAQSTEFAAALKRAGVEVVLQPVPGAGHGGPQFASPAANRLYKTFFDKHLKGARVEVEPLPAEELAAPQPAPAK
jgi:acetyl esterase/lipase